MQHKFVKFKKNRLLTGFTLIELIVVMAVFLFIIGAAISIFLSVFQQQKSILAQQEILNQISYVQEYMSKALRAAKSAISLSDTACLGESNAGYIYLLTHYDNSTQTYKGIKFLDQSGADPSGSAVCQEFFLDSDGILKEIKDGGSATALTPLNLQINSIKFSINGSDGTAAGCNSIDQCGASNQDSVQPRVTVLLNVNIIGDSQGINIACAQNSDCGITNICDLTVHKCAPTRTIQTTVSE